MYIYGYHSNSKAVLFFEADRRDPIINSINNIPRKQYTNIPFGFYKSFHRK